MSKFNELDYELFMALHKEIINEGNKFYEKTKDAPYPLFFSMLCVLIEQKCADEGLDLMEMYDTMIKTAEEIQKELGPILPMSKINE